VAPFSTVTDPKRLTKPSAAMESSVPQPHSAVRTFGIECPKLGVVDRRSFDQDVRPLVTAPNRSTAPLVAEALHRYDLSDCKEHHDVNAYLAC
jgi:hypothetical protein